MSLTSFDTKAADPIVRRWRADDVGPASAGPAFSAGFAARHFAPPAGSIVKGFTS